LPTIINNVETLSAVPAIINEGGEAYANRGTPRNGGTRLLCVAGHVNKPGIYEIPLGMNMKKFIYEMAGGIPNGKKLKAVIPGGSSCPIMTADEIDLPMDYDSGCESRLDARLRRNGRHGRRYLHGRHGAPHHAFLRARILRLVHPVP